MLSFKILSFPNNILLLYFYSTISERLPGPYFLRAGSMWQQIEKWCSEGGTGSPALPGQWITLCPKGVTQCANLLAFQAVYAFYAGQDSSETCLFGGYQIGIGEENMFEMKWSKPELSKKHPDHIVFLNTWVA